MATTNVISTESGTGFTVDVTAVNLLTDTTIKDFLVLIDDVLDNLSNWTKVTATSLQYGGPSLSSATVEIRRDTPVAPVNTYSFGARLASGDLNNEFDRITRRAEEYALNGIGPGTVVTTETPLDTAYPTGWNGDTVRPATRNALYDIISTLATIASPAFTGNPTAPTPSAGDNDTSIATTAFVQTELNDYATTASPTFTGTPAAPTATQGTDSAQLATTSFVQGEVENQADNFAIIEDVKANDTFGGAASAGYNTRTLNTETYDPNGLVTLSSNQFTLAAGTYEIVARAPAIQVDSHRIDLYNVTDASYDIIGAAEFAPNAATTDALLTYAGGGVITIASSKTFEIRHYCQTANASTSAFGIRIPTDTQQEHYTWCKITKLPQ